VSTERYEPAIGDTVAFDLDDMPHAGEVVEILSHNTVGVRITDLDYYGQKVYFNAGALQPVRFGATQGRKG